LILWAEMFNVLLWFNNAVEDCYYEYDL